MNPAPLPKRSWLLVAAAIASTPSLHAAEGESSLWSMIRDGGWAMIPLAACSLALIYLIVHCARETRAKRFGSEEFASRAAALCGAGQVAAALQAAQSEDSALGRVVTSALRKAETRGIPPAALEKELAESLELEENAVSQWIHYLSVIANVSPMIGLLGTVSGMIGGFQTMSAGGMGRPEMFAGDISEALITTAAGLTIGIPAMIAHSFFNNRLNTLMVETHRQASQAIDSLNAQPRPPKKIAQPL